MAFRAGERQQTIAADCVLLHQGVIPNINLASAAGCALGGSSVLGMACDDDSDVENAAEELGDAAEDAADKVEDAVD